MANGPAWPEGGQAGTARRATWAVPRRTSCLSNGPGTPCWAVFQAGLAREARPIQRAGLAQGPQREGSGEPEAGHPREAAAAAGALAPEADPTTGVLALEVGPREEAWRRRTLRARPRGRSGRRRARPGGGASRGGMKEADSARSPPSRSGRRRAHHGGGASQGGMEEADAARGR
jgi:hypothetical protein